MKVSLFFSRARESFLRVRGSEKMLLFGFYGSSGPTAGGIISIPWYEVFFIRLGTEKMLCASVGVLGACASRAWLWFLSVRCRLVLVSSKEISLGHGREERTDAFWHVPHASFVYSMQEYYDAVFELLYVLRWKM